MPSCRCSWLYQPKNEPDHDYNFQNNIVFSSDGARYGYSGKGEGLFYSVIDGVEGLGFPHLGTTEMCFSPDGLIVAFGAVVQFDEERENVRKLFKMMGEDSPARLLGTGETTMCVVVNNETGVSHDGFVTAGGGGRIEWEDDSTFRYLHISNGNRVHLTRTRVVMTERP